MFGKTLVELAEQDADIVAITAAMPDGTGLNKFAECYPQRFLDVGIAEQHAVTAAAGMAAAGMKPVVAVYFYIFYKERMIRCCTISACRICM